MFNHFLFTFVLGTLLAGSALAHDPEHVEGSGHVITERRQVADFSQVEIDGAFDTSISCQENTLLDITADDNIVPLILTEVRDGRLRVYSEKSFSTKKMLKVTIALQKLEQLEVSGSNNVTVRKVNSDALHLNASGSSTIIAEGQVTGLLSDLSGAATLHAMDLKADDVSVDISGAGNAEVYASKSLKAQILGAGSVVYDGNPEAVSRNILGAGSIEPR